LSNQQPSNYFW